MSLQAGIIPPNAIISDLLLELIDLASEHVRRAARRRADAARPRKGSTLRPGADTPLWNAVVVRARSRLRQRGAKANLARVLEVPRQRVHSYFVARTQMPDAERVLHILMWLAAGEPGEQPAARPKPLA